MHHPCPARLPRRHAWSALAALLCLATSLPAWSLDLLSAYQAALTEDATLLAARAVNSATRERLVQARAQLRPNINFSASRNHNDLSRSQTSNGQSTEFDEKYYSQNQTLQLRQPLYRRPLLATLAQAHHWVEDAQATLAQEERSLGQRLVASYLEVLLAQDELELVQKQQMTTTYQLDAARKSFAAGAGTRTDIDEVQARLDLNRARELEARQQLAMSGHRLGVLINRPVETLARLDPVRLPLNPPEPADLQAWVTQAEANNPQMQSLQAQLRAAELEVQRASAAHQPTLDLLLQATRSSSENTTTPASSYTNRMVGLQLNVPLYAGGYVQSQVRQALALQSEAEARLEALRRELAVQVHQELRGVSEGVLKVRAMEQAVRSADQLVTSSQRSFAAGARTLIDILNAEEALQKARRDLARERYLYLLSHYRLQTLTGTDMQQAMVSVNNTLQSPAPAGSP